MGGVILSVAVCAYIFPQKYQLANLIDSAVETRFIASNAIVANQATIANQDGDYQDAMNRVSTGVLGETDINQQQITIDQNLANQFIQIKGNLGNLGEIIQKDGQFYLAKNIIENGNIKRHTIKKINLDSGSVDSRIIEDHSIGSIDLENNLTIKNLMVDGNFVAPNVLYSISGTAHRLAVTNSQNPQIDIASDYAGQTSITTLGTITNGTWNGNTIGLAYGGTGTNNGSITGTGALNFSAGGTNQNITLTPSGSGQTILNGNVGIGNSTPDATLDIFTNTSTNAVQIIQQGSGPNVSLGQAGSVKNPSILFQTQQDLAPFNITRGGSYFTYNGTTVFDDLLGWGFNYGGNAVKLRPSAGMLGFQIESDFWGNNAYSGLPTHAMEFSLNYASSPSGSSVGRALAFGIDRDRGAGPTGYMNWVFGIGDANGSQFSIADRTLTNVLFNVAPSGRTTIGEDIILMKNSTPAIQVSNTNAIRLAMKDSDETVRAHFLFGSNDKITFGTAADTNLYRSAISTLRTDGDFTVGGNMTSTKFYNPINSTDNMISFSGLNGAGGGIAVANSVLYFNNTSGNPTFMLGSGKIRMGAGAGSGVTGRIELGAGAIGYDGNSNTSGLWFDSSDNANLSGNIMIKGVNNSSIAGNLGIGTTAPTQKLTVAGNINVVGGSFIDDGTTLNVPDYVFETGYILRTIPELENYLVQNMHLPGVSSRDQIKKNGMNYGSMIMSLLEKTEENTLYAIENYKNIQENKTQITSITNNQNKIVEQLTGQLADQSLSVDSKLQLIGQNLDNIQTQLIASLQDQITANTKDITDLKDQIKTLQDQTKSVIDFQLAFNLDKVIIKDALGNVSLLDGKITAKDIEVLNKIKATDIEATNSLKGKNIELSSDVSGTSLIKAGELESVKILTTEAKAGVKIYITPLDKLSGRSLYIDREKIEEGVGFSVELDGEILSKDVNFNWLIVK